MPAKHTAKRKQSKAPWERKRTSGTKKTKLSAADTKKARARASRAGRSYPNLVDNMKVAAEKKRGGAKSKRKKAATTA